MKANVVFVTSSCRGDSCKNNRAFPPSLCTNTSGDDSKPLDEQMENNGKREKY